MIGSPGFEFDEASLRERTGLAFIGPTIPAATAEAIPGSELVSFEGMGHDLPRELWPAIVDQISALVARGEALGQASD